MTPKVSFIVSSHNRPIELRLLLACLLLQSERNWEAIVTDNSDTNLAPLVEAEVLRFPDPRVRYLYTGNKANNPYRSADIGAAASIGAYLVFPSEDGYMIPWFLERMLRKAEGEALDLVYCDTVLGNPWVHRCLSVQPVIGNIDKTSFAVRREWFDKVGGFNVENVGGPAPSDGIFVEKLVAAGARHGRVDECLVIHN